MQQKINLNRNNKKATITIKLNKNLNGRRNKVNLNQKHIPTTITKRKIINTNQTNYYDDSYDDEFEDEIYDETEENYDSSDDETNDPLEQAKDKIKEKAKEKLKEKQQQNQKTENQQPNTQNSSTNGTTTSQTTTSNTMAGAEGEVVGETITSSGAVGEVAAGGGTVVGIVALVILVILIIILIVLIYYKINEDSGHGSFKYGVTCPMVTVTDTGCNASAKNCTHKYDGQVAFEDYVAGVVAAEVGSANNLEFYKVAAIAARTYFLRQADSSCTIKGNATRQAYMDVNDSGKASLIKQAVEETKSLVLVKNDKLSPTHYASACVVNDDGEYYHVRYGTISLGKANFQKIPKSWDSDSSHAYSGYLRSWYSDVDKSNTNYETKKCPGNHDYGMSQLGALYLATAENYNYEQIIKYYYGEDAEIMLNEVQLTEGSEGFVNPTRKIYCTSAFGWRIHPVSGVRKFHSGLDIGISGGEPIFAAADGVVTAVVSGVNAINNCNYGYGNYIIIDHGNGISTLYAHMKYGSIPSPITVGSSVSQGEQIGAVGSTGCSTGNHLHYEVRKNNKQVDPTDYMDLTNAKGTCKR